jgi:hypothetical protein
MLKSHKKTMIETLGRSSIHPFPARMAPGIALEALGENKAPLRVLDPMAGSGTVLAVARVKGHRAFGFDLDPLAVLIASVWTRTVDPEEVSEKAAGVLDDAKGVFSSLSSRCAYPSAADDETREFIRYWFDDYARRQLAALATTISRVEDQATRDLLWCCFSRLIITKQAGASRAMDLSHSRPHKVFDRAPVKPFRRFAAAVDAVVANCPQLGAGPVGPPTVVKQGDARRMRIADGSIDVVLTSPPYLNAIDYIRCSKFSLVWMGYTVSDLRKIRAESIGAEVSSEEAVEATWVRSVVKDLRLRPKLADRHHALLSQYVWDMGRAVAEVSRALRLGGRAIYVVGDSTVRGSFVRNSAIITAVAEEHGLSLASRHSRFLPANRRYLPPPKRTELDAAMNGRMRREVVMVFNKLVA